MFLNTYIKINNEYNHYYIKTEEVSIKLSIKYNIFN